ncbi:MAG: glycoside hydrolase family 32 protein [Spirochaetales bacterium]|nr:glycoside hydrolase family 32 protein [Spirochaetales bacterium]
MESSLTSIVQGDKFPQNGELYQEVLRPQFHFTSKIGWNNDPNGLMYYGGEYHLFYQHNPFGWNHGNMHWGHATSTDLVHWTELDEALHADELGTMFSGSGVVDHRNTTGLGDGDDPPLVCIYTAAGGTSRQSENHKFTQCIAFSHDRGRTWEKYGGNPVLEHIAANNRDPKVIWHEPTGRWVMALYLEENDYALFTSPNLIDWVRCCDLNIPGTTECPDIFVLPVDSSPHESKWVFWGASGDYVIGSFDGRQFEIESRPHRFQYGRSYAAQSWSDMPFSDGRRIQIAWLRGDKPDMPFNQQMTFPTELALRNTSDGIRMFAEPVKELEALNGRKQTFSPSDLQTAELGELLDVRVAIAAAEGSSGGKAVVNIRGTSLVYDRGKGTLQLGTDSAPLPYFNGPLELRILVDRSSIEVFAQKGALTLGIAMVPEKASTGIALELDGNLDAGMVEIVELVSSWR